MNNLKELTINGLNAYRLDSYAKYETIPEEQVKRITDNFKEEYDKFESEVKRKSRHKIYDLSNETLNKYTMLLSVYEEDIVVIKNEISIIENKIKTDYAKLINDTHNELIEQLNNLTKSNYTIAVEDTDIKEEYIIKHCKKCNIELNKDYVFEGFCEKCWNLEKGNINTDNYNNTYNDNLSFVEKYEVILLRL